ncbi:alkane 1-monooxygenase, partial [Rhodococcus baikonurensis]
MTATSDARQTGSKAVQNTDSPSGENPRWRDRKRYLWPLGLLIPLSPFISWFLVDNFRLGLFWA